MPSGKAIAYIKELNDTYQGKKIKFYCGDPMLFYSNIDDSDCNHIPVYEALYESIELVDTETRKLPMIITKDKNSLIDMVDITARDIYHLYFQRGSDYVSDNKRCTKTRSEKKKHWEPVFDFLYHHHNEVKILFTLSQYVWNAQKNELQSSDT